MLTEKQIKKFQKIYKKEFGKDISYEDARKQGTDVVELVRLTYKPIKKDEISKI